MKTPMELRYDKLGPRVAKALESRFFEAWYFSETGEFSALCDRARTDKSLMDFSPNIHVRITQTTPAFLAKLITRIETGCKIIILRID